MKFNITALIRLDPTIDMAHLKQILDPENITEDESEIKTFIDEDQVITKVQGEMSFGTLLRTLDDILQTINLAGSVGETIEEN